MNFGVSFHGNIIIKFIIVYYCRRRRRCCRCRCALNVAADSHGYIIYDYFTVEVSMCADKFF